MVALSEAIMPPGLAMNFRLPGMLIRSISEVMCVVIDAWTFWVLIDNRAVTTDTPRLCAMLRTMAASAVASARNSGGSVAKAVTFIGRKMQAMPKPCRKADQISGWL